MFAFVYINDVIFIAPHAFELQQFLFDLNNSFALKDLESFKPFLGLVVTTSSSSLHLSQTKFAHELHKMDRLDFSKEANSSMVFGSELNKFDGIYLNGPSQLFILMGVVQYCIITQPDITFIVSMLCQFLTTSTNVHFVATKYVLCYLKGSSQRFII